MKSVSSSNSFSGWYAALARHAPLAVLLGAIGIAGAGVLTKGLSHDEHMYVAAARLLDHGSIYADFAYLQTPYVPYALQFVLNAVGSGYALLTGRVLELLLVAASLGVFFRLARCSLSDGWFAGACILLVVESDITRLTIGCVRNYNAPMLLVLLAVGTFVSPRLKAAPMSACAIAGLLVGMAIGCKLTYALVPLAFVVPILVEHGFSRRFVHLVGSLTLGLMGGVLPALYLCLDAGLDRAFFSNVSYHTINAAWRAETGYTRSMSFVGKLADATEVLWTLPTMLLFVVGGVVLVSYLTRKEGRIGLPRSRLALTLATLVVVSLSMIFVPTPVWPSYYSPLVIWSSLLSAVLFTQLEPRAKLKVGWFGIACVCMVLANRFQDDVRLLRAVLRPGRWSCVEVHREGVALTSAIPETELNRPVATLSPIYALEGGMDIYPELAAGPFAYRIGTMLTTEEVEQFRISSVQHIADVLRERPPAAILVGFEDELDAPLETFAIENDFRKRDDVVRGGRLYVRPAGAN